MQTDPIGYEGGMNLYAYVGNDPVNFRDPMGLEGEGSEGENNDEEIIVTVCRVGTRMTFWGGCIKDTGGSGWVGFYTMPDVALPGVLVRLGFRFGSDLSPQAEKHCQAPQSTAEKIADWADTTGEYADAGAVASGTLGLITAPTGAGGVFFGGTALVLGGVGRAAAVVSIGANLIGGNVGGAGRSAVSLIGGSSAGYAAKAAVTRSLASRRTFGNLSASQQRATNVTGDAVAAGYGNLVGRIDC